MGFELKNQILLMGLVKTKTQDKIFFVVVHKYTVVYVAQWSFWAFLVNILARIMQTTIFFFAYNHLYYSFNLVTLNTMV